MSNPSREMNRYLASVVSIILLIALGSVGLLYKIEKDKNSLLRSENLKSAQDAQGEVERLKADLKKEKDKSLEDKKNLLDQITASSKEKDRTVKELEEVKRSVLKERELSLRVNEDVEILRQEVDVLRKQGREQAAGLAESFKKKQQMYETRVLSLEAQLSKSQKRFSTEAERYHYNLGVLYAQNKDYDAAVTEFKTALGYNQRNSSAHFNLGIIYDDYFKDKENAAYHYRTFLELSPVSDDAESVQEWLKDLGR